jgi:hypothetical protein
VQAAGKQTNLKFEISEMNGISPLRPAAQDSGRNDRMGLPTAQDSGQNDGMGLPTAQDSGQNDGIGLPVAQDSGQNDGIGLPTAQDSGRNDGMGLPVAQDFGRNDRTPCHHRRVNPDTDCKSNPTGQANPRDSAVAESYGGQETWGLRITAHLRSRLCNPAIRLR